MTLLGRGRLGDVAADSDRPATDDRERHVAAETEGLISGDNAERGQRGRGRDDERQEARGNDDVKVVHCSSLCAVGEPYEDVELAAERMAYARDSVRVVTFDRLVAARVHMLDDADVVAVRGLSIDLGQE